MVSKAYVPDRGAVLEEVFAKLVTLLDPAEADS
jgi:hypothetical protein